MKTKQISVRVPELVADKLTRKLREEGLTLQALLTSCVMDYLGQSHQLPKARVKAIAFRSKLNKVQTTVRINEEALKAMKSIAKKHGRSIGEEINLRLQKTLVDSVHLLDSKERKFVVRLYLLFHNAFNDLNAVVKRMLRDNQLDQKKLDEVLAFYSKLEELTLFFRQVLLEHNISFYYDDNH